MDNLKIIKIGDQEYVKLFDYTCSKCGKPISKNEWWDWDMCEECIIKINSKVNSK
ncbi:MAG: hypothetical protein LLF98_02615 [Clostridium sp.]|uniref:hypothetical protein n=1 Tax=Clostridium sp. TaxID=1506 RepID=UPI0025B8165F|nr:hypothetical protein [Clostridium sp.]MCE5220176.1 hypothetical protein [Clostridium sp.]